MPVLGSEYQRLCLMGCAHVARKLAMNARGARGIDVLFLANSHDRGLDHVLEFPLGLVPNYESFTVWVGGHVRYSKLDGFMSPVFQCLKVTNFLGLPYIT